MKILLSSHAFHPSVGGIETIAEILAAEFVQQGEEVRVVTTTEAKATKPFTYEIVRRPATRELFRLLSWSDVVLHVNISLRTGWPLLLAARPWVIAHHTWIPKGLRGVLKHRCVRMAQNISVSRAIAASLRVPSTVIPNAYDHDVFLEFSDVPRDRDLVFAGRLVSDKGVNCALAALRLLKQRGITPNFTIIGVGPEQARLREIVSESGLSDQVCFAGMKREKELARELGRHKIMLIPSLWEEPFGIVALEGIACGCVVVGSDRGGLPEAIGPCGMTFPNGDASTLADSLAELLANDAMLATYSRHAHAHLAGFRKLEVARRYLEVLRIATRSSESLPAGSWLQRDRC
jgi:glycosyltransferase involved in cell wall biosynthesis